MAFHLLLLMPCRKSVRTLMPSISEWRRFEINVLFVVLIQLGAFLLHLWVTLFTVLPLNSNIYVSATSTVINVCWKYFAKPIIMLLKYFINVNIICKCIHCGVNVVYTHPYSPLGNCFSLHVFITLLPFYGPAEKFICVAKGFVTSESST